MRLSFRELSRAQSKEAMSSFAKNVIPRRAHRERSQPSNRLERHGLLEKRKDYKLRAKDASRKKYRLKLLKEKAAFRNPDEFYHAMQSAPSTLEGRVRPRQDPNIAKPHDNVQGSIRRLVETQDRAYVGMKRRRERCMIETIKGSLHFLDAIRAETRKKHIVFLDRDEGESLADINLQNLHENARYGSSAADELKNGSKKNASKAENVSNSSPHVKAGKCRRRAYKELEQRVSRVAGLESAMEDLTLQAHLLGKGARKMVHRGDPRNGVLPTFKWRRQRKR